MKLDDGRIEAGLVLAGRFQLVERLGRGGIGEVWRAFDDVSGGEVACKILRGHLVGDRSAVSFLKREVVVSRRLRHPAIVEVHRFWEDEIHPFITMRYVAGWNLAQMLMKREEAFAVEDVLGWLELACDALDHAHGRGVVHRDVKPENFVICRDGGSVHLLDFGLAGGEWDEDGESGDGEIRGTLAYMSPEVLAGAHPGARSDQYGLAAAVYEVLAGAPPFSAGEVMAQIQIKLPPPIAALPESVNRVLLRALAKSPGRRFAVCKDFFKALEAAAAGKLQTSVAEALGDLADASRETAVQGGYEVPTRRTRLGKMLLEAGAIGQGDLAEGLMRQRETAEKLGKALIGLGHLSEQSLADVLAHQLQIPVVAEEIHMPDLDLARLAGLDKLRKFHALPLHRSPYAIVVAMADPLDMEALNYLEDTFCEPIDPVVATYEGIEVGLAVLESG